MECSHTKQITLVLLTVILNQCWHEASLWMERHPTMAPPLLAPNIISVKPVEIESIELGQSHEHLNYLYHLLI